MKKFFYVLLNTLHESRNHKTLVLSFLVAVFYIWLLGFHIDLEWQGSQIIQSQNSIWFGGEEDDYRLGFFFAYLFILLFAIFYSTGVIHQILEPEYVTLWLVKPISRKVFLTYQLLSTTILVWLVFLFLHAILWLCIGLRYEVWLGGLYLSLWLLLVNCLVLNCMALFFSLISKRAVSAAFFCLVFIFIIPFSAQLAKNNFGMDNIFGKYLISTLDFFSPNIGENFDQASELIFATYLNFSDILKMLAFGAVSYLGSIFIFDKKSI